MRNTSENKGEVLYGTLSTNVIESYIMANSRHHMSIYGERLLLKLVEIAQSQVLGLDFRGGNSLTRIDPYSLDPVVEVNISDLLGEGGSANYTKAKKAVLELMNVHHEHEEPVFKNGKPVYDSEGKQVFQFEAHQLLNDVNVNKKPGTIILNVNQNTWQALLDFSKGFRRYDIVLAYKLNREYSLRMYKLVSEQKNPITFTIDELRTKFGLAEKYKRPHDLMGVLDTAKKELDACSPWTFDYEPIFSKTSEENKGRAGRKACTSVRIHPIHQMKFETSNSRTLEVSPSFMLGQELYNYFMKFEFSPKEVSSNMTLIVACKKEFSDPDIYEFLRLIAPKAFRANDGNVKGYVIGALKRHLSEKYHYVFEKNKIVKEDPGLFDGLAAAMAGSMKKW